MVTKTSRAPSLNQCSANATYWSLHCKHYSFLPLTIIVSMDLIQRQNVCENMDSSRKLERHLQLILWVPVHRYSKLWDSDFTFHSVLQTQSQWKKRVVGADKTSTKQETSTKVSSLGSNASVNWFQQGCLDWWHEGHFFMDLMLDLWLQLLWLMWVCDKGRNRYRLNYRPFSCACWNEPRQRDFLDKTLLRSRLYSGTRWCLLNGRSKTKHHHI